jgi:serine/threonine-protein kinase
MHEITFKPGESCGNYRILSLIGIGGAAEVYKAAHKSTNSIVALKVLRRFFADNLYLKEHMLSEAKLLSGLRHENVVHVEDLGIEGGTLWMAMEHLPGAPLRSFLRGGRPLPFQMALHFARCIAAGAGAAHAAGSLHRGLTPENVMIGGRTKVKVLDRSTAKLYGWDTKRTAKGVIVGSPLYMPPEHVRDEVLDPRSDIYALGLILYEMLTGRHPFAPSSRRDVVSKHQICEMQMNVDPAPLAERSPGIPADLSAFVRRALSKDRYDRPSSMLEFEQALLPFLGPVVSEAQPVPSLRRISPRTSTSIAKPLPSAPRAVDEDDRPTPIFRRNDVLSQSSFPLSAPPTSREARSTQHSFNDIEPPPDSTSAFVSVARPSAPPEEPIPRRAPLLPFPDVRPRAVREPVPSLPGLTSVARPRSSGAVTPFELAYEAASARRKLKRTSFALRVGAGMGTVVAVLALTYARLSAAPGGVETVVKAFASALETTPTEAAVAATDNVALEQPAPASPMAVTTQQAPAAAPTPPPEKPAAPKITPICRPTPVASTTPEKQPEKAKPAQSSDPYEDAELRPNPYDDVYEDKSAPPPKPTPAPSKKPNPFSPHGF